MISTRIRLIALDLDGTLVGPDLTISPRVRESITRARARGAQITIVTGRMFAATKPYAQTLGITGPLVCYQGAAIFEASTGAVLRETPVHQNNRVSKRYTDIAKVEPKLVPSLSAAFADRPSIKIVLVDDPVPSEEHLAALKPLLGDRAYLTRSHVDFVEVLSPDVNKGEALAFVAQRYGATLTETLAIGDAWNDVPLITAAGIGVAMGSGPPELFAQADAVVGDVAHDGVAEAIERYVLT